MNEMPEQIARRHTDLNIPTRPFLHSFIPPSSREFQRSYTSGALLLLSTNLRFGIVGIVGFPMLRKMIRKGTIISWAMNQAVTFGLDKKESLEDKEFCTHISSPSPITPCPQSCSMISVHILFESSCSRPLPP